ncbi:ArsR/SmtB family transcription factor [Thermococcus sp.]
MKWGIVIVQKDIAQRSATIFKALSSPIRLKILALCLDGEKTSRELREKLGISKPLLISHLRKLISSGLLEYRVEFDERRMIVRKYYRTKNVDLCMMAILREIIRELKLGSSNQK